MGPRVGLPALDFVSLRSHGVLSLLVRDVFGIGLFPKCFVDRRECLLAVGDGTEGVSGSVFNQMREASPHRDIAFSYGSKVARYLYPLILRGLVAGDGMCDYCDHMIFHNPSRTREDAVIAQPASRHLTTIAYTILLRPAALRILFAQDNAHKHSPQIAHPSLAEPSLLVTLKVPLVRRAPKTRTISF